jgi:cytochrome c oxidase subunit 4
MENPEYVTGIPLAIIAGIGLMIAFSLFFIPEKADGPAQKAVHAGPQHPEPFQYVVVGIILAGITAFEVMLYYIEGLNFEFLVLVLVVLSALKFFIVVGFFMHLRFDARLFSILFFGGLALAIAVFTVAIATLQAGLV